jgi:hypothetical protein
MCFNDGSYARCGQSNWPSFFLLHIRNSSPTWLFEILPHFSHDRSKWSSPSFPSTTFQNFARISDLLFEVSNFQHIQCYAPIVAQWTIYEVQNWMVINNLEVLNTMVGSNMQLNTLYLKTKFVPPRHTAPHLYHLKMFTEVTTIYFKNEIHKGTCWHNSKIQNIKVSGTHRYHCNTALIVKRR